MGGYVFFCVMKFPQSQTLKSIAQIIGCEYVGAPDFSVTGINEIHRVQPGDICFVDHPKYYQKALESAATCIIIDQKVDCPEGKSLIISETPFKHYNELAKHFRPFVPFEQEDQAKIGEGTVIAPNVVLHKDVVIGDNCVIHPGVVVYGNVQIGNNVIIHANTVIGSDAFYYNKKQGVYNKMHSCGDVVIEDSVEIGASCTLDKGVSATTRIGKGTKLDNHIHVAHDVEIGENCLFAAGTAIAGCVTIGNNVTVWGQVAISSSVSIGDGAEILAKSGVNKNLEGGKRYFGAPAIDAREKMREMAAVKGLLKRD